jgi:mycofactocin precursor
MGAVTRDLARTARTERMAEILSITTADETPPAMWPPEAQAGPAEPIASDVDEPAILAEVLVEELSIDGMCGVY